MQHLAGVDEVGRGPLAGPLTAAAVVLPPKYTIDHLADSKSLTAARRQQALRGIQQTALAIGVGWASADYIDSYGLTRATQRAMVNAMRQIRLPITKVILDGAYNYLAQWYDCEAIINADKTHGPVAAASIVAKQARDSYMAAMDGLYPQYGFAQHMGYGTPAHTKAIGSHGPCCLHRLSFKPLGGLAAKI